MQQGDNGSDVIADGNEALPDARTKNAKRSKDGASRSTAGTTADDAKEEITLLDTLAVERERGITVKASAASMLYRRRSSSTNPKGWMLLNMVDTPGHADFGMEVSKSLESVEGAVLLFDSAQGIQAQTLSVYDKARMVGERRRKDAEGLRRRRRPGSDGNGEESSADADEGTGGIRILPALTKVDMPSSRPLEVALAVSDLMGFDPDTILKVCHSFLRKG